MYKKNFAKRLRVARGVMSQVDVSRITGIPQSSISKFESGKLEPSIEILGRLANFYQVSVDWLLSMPGSK